MRRVAQKLRGAHASGVLVSAFCRNELPSASRKFRPRPKKFAMFWRTSPARRRRALPGIGCRAFTIIELLIVMAIIIVLAGLVIATSGYVQEKSRRSRAEAEIAAMSAALESYKADNGVYPNDPATDAVDPTAATVSADPSKFLYANLSGDSNFDGVPENKSYMTFKPQNLKGEDPRQPIGPGNHVAALRDPFGDPYGYSTMKAADPNSPGGFNPTFDLWSTAGTESASALDQAKWIKNW